MPVYSSAINQMQLPTEIVAIILDYLKGDTTSLKTCSLLSYQWLGCARRILWHTIVLRNQDDFRHWQKSLRAHPEMARVYPQCISLRPDSQQLEADMFSDLPSLPSVKKLSIYGHISPDLCSRTRAGTRFSRFVSSLSSLRDLSLYVAARRLDGLAALLVTFKRLETLKLHSFHGHRLFSTELRVQPDSEFDFSALTNLHFDVPWERRMDAITMWLLREQNPNNLRALSLTLTNESNPRPLAQTIAAFANSLEQLTLRTSLSSLSSHSRQLPRTSIINQPMPHLREIILHVKRTSTPLWQNRRLKILLGCLQDMPQIRSVETVSIVLDRFHTKESFLGLFRDTMG